VFERFTRSARVVVEDASYLARRSGSPELRPPHLLEALLADPNVEAVRLLDGLGAPHAELRQVVSGLRGPGIGGLDADDVDALQSLGIDVEEVARRLPSGPTWTSRRPRFTRESKKVLEHALRAAVGLRDSFIGTEHLLLGLLDSGDRPTRETLAAFDLDVDDVRTAVADQRRRGQASAC